MAVRYLLDTNTASCIIRGKPPRVRERLVRIPLAEVGISVLTEAELRFGVARRLDVRGLAAAVEQFLVRVERLPLNSAIAKEYAEMRAVLERHGEIMGHQEMMIAAQAVAAGAVLVTADRVFGKIKQLKVEDWTR